MRKRKKCSRRIENQSHEKSHLASNDLWSGSRPWARKQSDKNRIIEAEMWLYRRTLRISWKERRTDESILKELGTTP